jgi:vancomycin permeability regulator SanA
VLRFKRITLFALGMIIGLTLYPILLMSTVGNHKADKHTDAALVLGARVYEDGSPSNALHDRVIAGVELYQAGLCDVLVFSGGPGVGAWSEPAVMRRIAMEHGIPLSAIVLDEHGYNTGASARNYAVLRREHGWVSVTGVTHFYHTPRLKLALRREGIQAETHAAIRRGLVLKKLPLFVARETAAWWAYVLGIK